MTTSNSEPRRRVLLPPASALPEPPQQGDVCELRGDTMGTTWSLRYVDAGDIDVYDLHAAVQERLDRVVAQMSTWEPDSDLCRFNRAERGWHPLPEAFFTVLSCALEIAADTDGAYDPAAGALVDLWGFGPHPAPEEPPAEADIAQAKARGDWRRVRLDATAGSAWQDGGVSLDLSSIAKGFGVDQAAEAAREMGLQHFLVEVGGELLGQGFKPDGMPWWVELEQPDNAGDTFETLVGLYTGAVATSGDYRRYFEHEGQRYAHTLDPRSGRPVANALCSVSVLHPSCMRADALATALTVLGPQAGYDYAVQRGIAAVLVERGDEEAHERLTPALAEFLS